METYGNVNGNSPQNKRQQESQRRNADVTSPDRYNHWPSLGEQVDDGTGEQQQHGTAP